MHYSNKCRKPSIKYQINDWVYLLTKNLTLLKHRAWKLIPKFIGPYKILKVMNESTNVMLEHPQEFKDRKINPTFHTNLVWPYIKNNDILFPKRDTKVYYDFGNDKDQEWLVKEILAHKWTNNDLELQVKWMLGDVTWELLSSCKDLKALDAYLELWGAKAPRDLSQCEQANKVGSHAVTSYVTQLKRFSTRWLDNNHQGFSQTTTTVHLGVLQKKPTSNSVA